MEVRVFEGMTMKDAIGSVKEAFGSKAVILGTKEKTHSGGQKSYEITAAASAESAKKIGNRFDDQEDHLLTKDLKQVEEQLNSMNIKLSHLWEKMIRKDDLSLFESGIEELKTLVFEYLPQGDTEKNVKEELRALFTKLKVAGIDGTYIDSLIKHLGSISEWTKFESKQVSEAQLKESLQQEAIKWMLHRVRVHPSFLRNQEEQDIKAVVGTSGSGKTTAVVKLAHAIHKKYPDKKMLVCSVGSFLPGQTETLRVYSKILEIDYASLGSIEELSSKLRESHNKKYDVVLLDMDMNSGRNEKLNEDAARRLSATGLPVEVHLVLPLNEKPRLLERSIRSFSPFGLESLIFTKTDEGILYGDVFNLSVKWDVPISFFSTGRGIPNDFEKASRERVVERIFSL